MVADLRFRLSRIFFSHLKTATLYAFHGILAPGLSVEQVEFSEILRILLSFSHGRVGADR
jgi:hypothetical protein